MEKNLFEIETLEKPRSAPAVTIGVSSAAFAAIVMVVLHAMFGDTVMLLPGAGAAVKAQAIEEIKTLLVNHQAAMATQIDRETHTFDQVQKLLTVMCVQQAKSATDRDACLRP